MEENMTLFDLLPEDEAARFKPIKSTDWKWTFADYPKEKNGLKVFSCFACGGGSTMGYKLAGCDVIGCCEIDPKMNEVYVNNHHPKYNFLMDIRDFNAIPNEELPQELFDLDVLDGSPPCTTFSMAGEREESWGKKKKFREGQKEQTLDDLSFVFIETVKKIKPRVVIMENVEGLIKGEAFTYVQKIYKQFDEAGYNVHHWLLKGEQMGIPQTRHRVFFIAIRNDIGLKPAEINMCFNYAPITYGDIKEGNVIQMLEDSLLLEMAKKAEEKDKTVSDTRVRIGEKESAFQVYYLRENAICPTIRGAKADWIDMKELAWVSLETVRNSQTFPKDYKFGTLSRMNVGYICGMSVPPVMMKRIIMRLIDEGVFKYKGVG